jgi:hypothetical protein
MRRAENAGIMGAACCFYNIFALVCIDLLMGATNPSSPSEPSGRCAQCGCAFDCGGTTRPFDCWCARMPALPAVSAQGGGTSRVRAGGCLCPACYAEALAGPGGMGDSGDSGAASGSPGADGRRGNSTD